MSNEFQSQVQIDMLDDSVLSGEDRISPVTIRWEIEFEMRDWGIKGVYVTVPDQKIVLNYTVWSEDGQDEVEQSKEINLIDVQVDLDDANITRGLAPKSLEFYQGRVQVVF